MKKLAVMALVVVGAVLPLAIHFKSEAYIRGREALWRERKEQMAALNAEHRRLSNLAANIPDVSQDDHSAELAKLRRAAESLKKQTNDLGRHLAARQSTGPAKPSADHESHPPEYWEQLHKTAAGRFTDANYLTSAIFKYTDDHQGQFPASIDQLAPYLAKAKQTLSGTNQFEIIYQGSIHELDGFPDHTVAIFRTQDTWPGPDGRPTRVYGFAEGGHAVLSSEDNFQAWEAKHTIAPPKAGQPGK